MTAKKKRGFTLAELVVTAAITVIVIGAAATIMITGLNIFGKSAQTAREQREITLAETALKENMVTATSYNITDTITVPTSSDDTENTDIYIAFEDDTLVMWIGKTKVTATDITEIDLTFVFKSGVCTAQYTIKTKGISHTGLIVMNNIKSVPGGEERYTLAPDSPNVLHMVIPKIDSGA
jgi:prepilin-type N-terminal cleavage/methylation domain-containing protein